MRNIALRVTQPHALAFYSRISKSKVLPRHHLICLPFQRPPDSLRTPAVLSEEHGPREGHQQSQQPIGCLGSLLYLDITSSLQPLLAQGRWAAWCHSAQAMVMHCHLLPWFFLQRWVSHGLICSGKEHKRHQQRLQGGDSWRPERHSKGRTRAYLSNPPLVHIDQESRACLAM